MQKHQLFTALCLLLVVEATAQEVLDALTYDNTQD